eukprot:10537694-Lingulodinium_polyedra.AAC.1
MERRRSEPARAAGNPGRRGRGPRPRRRMSLPNSILLREVGAASVFWGPLPPARALGWQNWRRDLCVQAPELQEQ